MKRVAIIAPEWGREKGGIQNWIYYIERLLKDEGFAVSHFAWRDEGILRSFKSFGADRYILATWKMTLFALPALFLKKPVLILVHGNEILGLKGIWKAWLRFLRKKPNIFFVANSRAIAKIFEDELGFGVDGVQHPFMEIPDDPPLQNSRKDAPVFLSVSRLVPRKNIHGVLQALATLKKEGFAFRYFIAGDGPDKKRLMELATSLGLEDEVVFCGKVDEAQKRRLYSQSDYLLLPSLYDKEGRSIEGFGIVFIEANAYGLPVLGGKSGGMAEAIVDGVTGLLSDGSSEDIAKKIKQLTATEFDRAVLREHAKKFDYKKQRRFLRWIKEGEVR